MNNFFLLTHCVPVDSPDESTCHFRNVGSNLSLFSTFDDKNPLGKQCRPDQTPHDVASDLGLHCLFMALLRV